MIKTGYALFLFLTLVSCSPKQPAPACPDAGKFIMTLKNENGVIKRDTVSKTYRIYFSPDGSLAPNTTGIPCNLSADFQAELNVRFDADFFETDLDSSARTFSMYIRKIDYR